MSGPQKAKGPTVAAVGPHGMAQSVSLSSGTSVADDKAFHTLRARLALAGRTLSRTDASDGARAYFVSGWGMVRELRDLDTVAAFAKQVGGVHG